MKKLLALVLVLGMASIGSAAIVDIAVQDGTTYSRTITEMTVNVSDMVHLGLYRLNPTGYLSGKYYVLVCETAKGSINGGVSNVFPGINEDGAIQIVATSFKPAREYKPDLPQGVDGMGYNYFNFDEFNADNDELSEVVPAGMYWQDIVFHCEAAGDVIVEVWSSNNLGSTAAWTLNDSLLIHQIPEPMTMSLLALGGLGLIRRRRA